MVALISMADAKDILRISHDDDDAMIAGMINAASEDVLSYLKAGSAAWYDADTDTLTGVVPQRVDVAVRKYVLGLYDNTDEFMQAGKGELPKSVEMLLYRLRDPALQ